jgi:hypothetical protein
MDISGKWISTWKKGTELLVVKKSSNLFVMVEPKNPKNTNDLIINDNKIIMNNAIKGFIKRGHLKKDN